MPSRKTVLKAIGAALALLVLYFASLGPVWYVGTHYDVPDPIYNSAITIYDPILWLAEDVEAVADLLVRYMDFWESIPEPPFARRSQVI